MRAKPHPYRRAATFVGGQKRENPQCRGHQIPVHVCSGRFPAFFVIGLDRQRLQPTDGKMPRSGDTGEAFNTTCGTDFVSVSAPAKPPLSASASRLLPLGLASLLQFFGRGNNPCAFRSRGQ